MTSLTFWRRLPAGAPALAQVTGSGRAPGFVTLLAAGWMATACNLALWNKLSELGLLHGARGLLLGLGCAGIIGALIVTLVSLLAWRWTLKPVLTVLLLTASAALHFMWVYRIVIDPSMVVNVLQTDTREAADLLSLRLLVTLLLTGALPVVLLWRTPVRYGTPGRRALGNLGLFVASLLLAAGLLLACFQPLSSLMRNHKEVRYLINPLNAVWAVADVAAKPLRRADGPLQPIGEDAVLGTSYARQAQPPLVVLVLGETGRAGNFGLNGYGRDTTPELARENVASLRNVWSCGTSTAASVPCMFSHLGREAYLDRKQDSEGLMDVLQRAGLAVLWLDNQSGCKGVCDRVPNVNTSALADAQLCPGGQCQDMIMLKGLDERIAALAPERRARGVVVVMHQMGSHGPAYSKRSPPEFKRFLPECTSASLQECSRESLVNAYDSSIAYTDHFLASTIRWLKAKGSQPTALVYLADHGESLGENNLYLHGLPYAVAPDVQKRVPWITWLSPAYEQRSGLRTACLKQQAEQRRSHDDWFHSVLGLLDVQTGVYRRANDLYAPCTEG